jgi:hypothetical protein
MPNGQNQQFNPPDPETLLIIGAVGAIFGALTAVGTFLLYDWAERAGPRLETPGPVRLLAQSLAGAAEPFQPERIFSNSNGGRWP